MERVGQPLRVLMVGLFPEDPGRPVGGVEAATFSLSSALAEHVGIEKVVVASIRKGRSKAPVRYGEKLEVHQIGVPFVSGDAIIRSEQAMAPVRRLAREFRPHVAHGQGIDRHGEIATRLGLPTVVTVHGLIHVEAQLVGRSWHSRLRAAMFEGMIQRVLDRSKVIISISDYDFKALNGMIAGARVSIPNAVPSDFFAPGASEDSDRVLFAGVVRPRKNVLGLVQAFAELHRRRPSSHLVIAGPTPDAAYLELVKARVSDLGIEDAVRILGHVSNQELIENIQRASVLALFSREETLPTIIAQTMAAGRPVVASDVGGIPEMINNGQNGYLVASEDEAALADRLFAVLCDRSLARRMGEAGAIAARERYTAESVALRTIAAYQLAMSS